MSGEEPGRKNAWEALVKAVWKMIVRIYLPVRCKIRIIKHLGGMVAADHTYDISCIGSEGVLYLNNSTRSA